MLWIVNIKKALGLNLRKHRKLKGWTQIDLAETAGITSKYVSVIELGNSWPQYETLSALAGALEISVGQLVLDPDLTEPSNEQVLSTVKKALGL